MNKIFIAFCVFFLFESSLNAQGFEGGFKGGLNFAQVDGDYNAGYNKLGFNGGVFVHYVFPSTRNSLGFDLMYMGKGSRNKYDPQNSTPIFIYSYHYIELPLYYRFIQKKYSISTGLVWAYVFSSKFDDGGSAKKIYGLRKTDYLYHIGAEYFLTDKISVYAGYQYSIRSIIDIDKSSINVPLAQFRRNGVYHNLIQTSVKYFLSK